MDLDMGVRQLYLMTSPTLTLPVWWTRSIVTTCHQFYCPALTLSAEHATWVVPLKLGVAVDCLHLQYGRTQISVDAQGNMWNQLHRIVVRLA